MKKNWNPRHIDFFAKYLDNKFKVRISNETVFKEFEKVFVEDVSYASNTCYFFIDLDDELIKLGWVADDLNWKRKDYKPPKKNKRINKSQMRLDI